MGNINWPLWHRWRDLDEYRAQYGRTGYEHSKKPSDFFSLSSLAVPGLGDKITLADTLPSSEFERMSVERMDLAAMVNLLPARTRGILVATAQGYTAVEISGWCGISESRIWQILKDARSRMKAAISQGVPLNVPSGVGVSR